MAYFPLFNITDAVGFTTLANFSPNNWEKPVKGDLFVTSFRTNGEVWRAHDEGIIEFNSFRKFEANQFDLKLQESESEIILFQISDKRIEPELFKLQPDNLISTHLPEWRATVGFKRNGAQTSYQGEVNPFPNMASLLTFHPFIQVQETENYFVLLNVESSPVFRWSELEIYNSNTRKLIDIVNVKNNCINIILLDQYGFTDNELPIFQCKTMAGIPFGFGKSKTSSILSLEHTHPPGSLTLFGNRFSAQKHTKSRWSEFLKS
jgi:hypothetical protein